MKPNNITKQILGVKDEIPFQYSYTITTTNFTVLSDYKQQKKLDDFFTLLKNCDKEIMITLERAPLTVLYKGKDTKMNILQVLIDSISPLDDILEKSGFSYTIDEQHKKMNIINEEIQSFQEKQKDGKIRFGRVYTLYKHPTVLPPAWIHSLFESFDMIRMHISPVLPDQAMSKIKKKELLYMDNKSLQADILKKIDDIKILKRNLELGNDKIFEIIINGFVFTDTRKKIRKINQKIRKELTAINVRMTESWGQQRNFINGDGVSWIYDVGSTLILYPFSSSDMIETPNGVMLGINKETNSPVIYDPDFRANHNIFTCGTTGSGKSFTNKILIKRFSEKRPKCMRCIIDPQGEYIQYADYFGMNSIEIIAGKQYGLDPFKLFDTNIEACDILGVVTEAPKTIQKEWRSICNKVNSVKELYDKSTPKAQDFLVDLVRGDVSEILKGDIKFNDNMIISLKYLDGQEYESLIILLTLTYAWKRVNTLPANQWKFILLDEAWRMTKYLKSSYKIGEIARQGRKKSLIFAISTQQFTDLDDSLKDVSKLTELFDTKIIMQLSRTASQHTGESMDLTDDEIDRIMNFKQGNGLLQTGTNSIYIKFEATEDEEKIYFNTTEKKLEE